LPIFHPLVATSSVFGITGVAEVVVKLILRSEPLHVLTFTTKYSDSHFSTNLAQSCFDTSL
jgi:hypothetical protein